MPLFQRFFAIAVLVLVFHSILSGLLVTERVRDRERELAIASVDDSSHLAYESFNNWKRALWGQLVGLTDGATTAQIVEELRPRRTVDWVVRTVEEPGDSRNPDSGGADVASVMGFPWPAEVADASEQPLRPRISVEQRGTTMFLRASRPFSTPDDRDGAIHLIKAIDETFCRRLAIDSAATATFMTSLGRLPGLPDIPSADGFEQAISEQPGYERLLGVDGAADGRLNAGLRNAGVLLTDQGAVSLYLLVLLDGGREEQRLHTMARSLLLASALSVGLSAGLILLGSWTVTKPIIRLTHAMERVAQGNLSVRLGDVRNRESRTLIDGFNRMTRELEQAARERERHVEEITALTAANETVFHSISSAMITLDHDLHIQRVNRAAAALLGLKEAGVRGTHLETVGTRELQHHLVSIAQRVYSGADSIHGEIRRTKSRVYELGGYRLRAGYGTALVGAESCLLVVEDVTEKVSLEERMVQAERLSSLAILTAGVAHEINNPLSSITTNVQNLADEIEDPEQRRAIEYVQQETRRIRDIVERLNDFSGRGGTGPLWADVNKEVASVLSTVRYSLSPGRDVSLRTELAESLPPTRVAADELRQILLNLVTNAVQALDDDGGTVCVRTGTHNRQSLWLEVEDNGRGISEDEQQRIFDPFFTTKPNGSGLGLSVAYGLLNRYNGSCTIRSVPGEGTTVHLSMPIHEESRHDGK